MFSSLILFSYDANGPVGTHRGVCRGPGSTLVVSTVRHVTAGRGLPAWRWQLRSRLLLGAQAGVGTDDLSAVRQGGYRVECGCEPAPIHRQCHRRVAGAPAGAGNSETIPTRRA